MWNVTFFIIVVSIGALIRLGTYVVDEGSQVVLTQFGAIMDEPSVEPGLYFRIPFIQKTHYVEKRIQTWDGQIDYIPTKDRQYIAVESVAHWQIVDPIRYMEALGSQELALSRLDAILIGAVKDMVSTHAMVDTVRNSNRIVNERRESEEFSEEDSVRNNSMKAQLSHSITSGLELVTLGREHLTQKMYADASIELMKLGIRLVGIYIQRVSYEPEVERKVYSRMISERTRIAERLLSVGRSQREQILGQVAHDANAILAPAIRQAEIIRGEADAEALAIYNEAFGEDPEFYEFWRSIQAYRTSLPDNTSIITSTDTDFYHTLFHHPMTKLRKSRGQIPASAEVSTPERPDVPSAGTQTISSDER